MMTDRIPQADSAVAIRARARTLAKAGWRNEAIDLLRQGAAGHARWDVGIRLDLAEALLAAGRIEDAEAVRLPGDDR